VAALNIRKLLLVFILVLLCSQIAFGWWNSSYNYRRQLNFTNTSHYYEPIIYNLTEICGSNCQADFEDIRFYDETNSTELDYEFLDDEFILTSRSGKTPSYAQTIIPSSGNDVYIYYGNDDVGDVSKTLFNATMIFYNGIQNYTGNGFDRNTTAGIDDGYGLNSLKVLTSGTFGQSPFPINKYMSFFLFDEYSSTSNEQGYMRKYAGEDAYVFVSSSSCDSGNSYCFLGGSWADMHKRQKQIWQNILINWTPSTSYNLYHSNSSESALPLYGGSWTTQVSGNVTSFYSYGGMNVYYLDSIRTSNIYFQQYFNPNKPYVLAETASTVVTTPEITDIQIESSIGFNTTFENWTNTGYSSNANATFKLTNMSWFSSPSKGMITGYPFDINATDISGNAHNGAVTGATLVSGLYGNAYSFDGIDDGITNIDNIILGNEFTICFWDNCIGEDDNGNEGAWLYGYNSTNTKIEFRREYGDDGYYFVVYNESGQYSRLYDQAVTGMGYNQWNFICGKRMANGQLEFWLNGNNETAGATSSIATGNTATFDLMVIGKRWDNVYAMNGTLDEFRFYNYSLTADQIYQLYQNGAKTLSSEETATGEDWTFNIVPMSNETYGDIATYSFSIEDYSIEVLQDSPPDQYATNESFLYLECNATKSMPFVELGNITVNVYDGNLSLYDSYTTSTGGNNYSVSYGVTFGDGNYSWECVLDELTGDKTSVAGNRTWWTDTTAPVLANYTFNIDQAIYMGKNITGTFNYTDTNLFKINATIDGTQIFTESDINATSYLYSLNYNTSALTAGNHTLSITMYDSHTAEILKEDYRVSSPLLSTKLSFETDNNRIEIRPTDKSLALFNPFTAKKLKDRYTFSYKPDKYTESYSFEVETDETLHIVKNSDMVYKQWIVSGNNWIDFYTPNSRNARVSISKVTDTKALVTVTGIEPNPDGKIYFNSVGELNSRTDTFNFYTYNVSLTYQTEVEETEEQSTVLDIYLNGIPFNSSIASQFVFNNTAKGISETVNSSDSVTLNSTFITPIINTTAVLEGIWYLNVSTDTNEFRFNQTVRQLSFDNCSTYGNKVLQLRIFEEDDTDSLLNSTMAAELTFWSSVSNTSKTLNLDFTGNSTYYICALNESSSVKSDIYLQYTPSGSFTHRWYAFAYNLTGTIQRNESVYNFVNKTDKSDLKITTRYNSDYNYYPDIIGKLQRSYLAEGVWRTVQMDRSGDFGNLFYNIIEESVDYRLIFTDISNNVLKTTDTLKFLCTDGICDLTVLLDPYSATAASSGEVVVTQSYDSATSTINISWSDLSAGTNTVTSTVKQIGGVSDTTICNQTQTGASGSYSCDVSTYSGEVEVQVIDDGSVVVTEFVHINRAR